MNAETKSNAVELALSASTTLLTVNEIRRATGLDDEEIIVQLKALNQQGQIEHVPGRGKYGHRYGLLRPIVKATPDVAEVQVSAADEAKSDDVSATIEGKPDFGRDPELQYLAPEGCEMPEPDAKLLAMANRMLSERLDGVAHALRGCGLPALVEVTGGEDLQLHVAALSGAYQMACTKLDERTIERNFANGDAAAAEKKRVETTAELTKAMQDLDQIRELLAPHSGQIDPSDMSEVELAKHAAAELTNATALNAKLEHLLGVERQSNAALQEQLDHLTHGGDAESPALCASLIDSYAVVAPKRPMRRFTGHDNAVKSAMAAAANGSGRGEVFALVPVGVAKHGAVWSAVK